MEKEKKQNMFNFNKNFRKIRRNVKAISPVISVLLMIAVAVVASLVAYAWVMGYIGFQTAKTGQAIQIQSMSLNTNKTFTVYVQNVGDSDVILSTNGFYINGAQATGITIIDSKGVANTTLAKGSTLQLNGMPSPALTAGVQEVTFKVTNTGGTFSEVSKQFTIP
jgi:flagellin-like protein